MFNNHKNTSVYSQTFKLCGIILCILSLLASCTAPLRADGITFELRLRESSDFTITKWFCRNNNELLASAFDGSDEYLLCFALDKTGYPNKMQLCCDLEQTDKGKFLSDIKLFCFAFSGVPIDKKAYAEIKNTPIGKSGNGFCKTNDGLYEFSILYIGTTAVFTVVPMSAIYQSSLSISSG